MPFILVQAIKKQKLVTTNTFHNTYLLQHANMIDRCVALVKNKNKFCKIGTDNGTQMQVDSHPNMSSEAL